MSCRGTEWEERREKRERKGRYTGKKQSKRGEELQSKEIGKINVTHKILDKEENRKWREKMHFLKGRCCCAWEIK